MKHPKTGLCQEFSTGMRELDPFCFYRLVSSPRKALPSAHIILVYPHAPMSSLGAAGLGATGGTEKCRRGSLILNNIVRNWAGSTD
jgi:hypothetical protein